MLLILGDFIQRHPWMVVWIVIVVTVGFGSFIPSLDFKTDFENFSPEDPTVQANEKIQDYFSENQQMLFLKVEKINTKGILEPMVLREIETMQKILLENPNVNSSISIVTFLDIICQLEFGLPLKDCTDQQIETAVGDMFSIQDYQHMALFNKDDTNEEIDYKRFNFLSKGRSLDAIDLKNCYLTKTNETMEIAFEVYDLSVFSSQITPVIPQVNVMEWYLTVNNLIIPIEDLDIEYRFAVHIEPLHPLWEVGKGPIENIRTILHHLKERELWKKYVVEPYLWISPSGEELSLPLKLQTGSIEFDIPNNRMILSVDLEELQSFGIAPQYGSFALPAKLSNFTAGTRYYKTSFFNFAGGRVTANTSFLYQTLKNIQQRPLLGKIATSILEKSGNITWEEFDDLYQLMQQTNMLPEYIGLSDIESSWKQADVVINNQNAFSQSVLIVPSIYEDIRQMAMSLLSKDFSNELQPSSTIIFTQFNPTKDYDTIVTMNSDVLKSIESFNENSTIINIKGTGAGILTVEINELTTDTNQFLVPLIFLIIIIVLYINFRRISYVVLPMLSLIISTIWLFGCMALLGIDFNVIAVALVPLIMGLGVDYAVHLYHNYRVYLEDGYKPALAIKKSVSEIGTAMFLAMITTVIAFLSFLTASVPPIRDFGVLLALGIIFTFITSITLLAALRFIIDRKKQISIDRKQQGLIVRKIMGLLSKKVLAHQKKILFFMALITILFGLGALQIETGFDMQAFAPKDTPSSELYYEIADDFPFSSQSQEYILIEGDVASVETLQGIRRTHQNLEDDSFVARNKDESIQTTSIYTVIQQALDNNQSLITSFNVDEQTGIPRTDQDVKDLIDYLFETKTPSMSDINLNVIEYDINESSMFEFSLDSFGGDIKSVISKEGDTYVATLIRIYLDPSFSTIEGNINDELELMKKEFTNDISSYGSANAIATGPNIISLTITQSLTESQILSTVASILLAALVLIVVYRNPTLGLITLAPVGISIIWILGTMYFIGYSLNVLTITVTSITIGIGIDYAIHATERFRYIVDKTGDITKAVCETISHTGGALLIAALTTALGFGVLVFAPIPPQQQFGLILAITIIYSFLTSIFILPLILYHWGNWRKKRKGFIVRSNGFFFSSSLSKKNKK